jgi:hypothetical protein
VPNVQQLVYLAAYVPDIGESLFSLHGAPDPDSTEDLFPIGSDPRALRRQRRPLRRGAPQRAGRPT